MGKISSNELVDVVNEQLVNRKEEAIKIGISDKEIGLYYQSRSDILEDALYEDVLRLNSDIGESTSSKSCKDTLNLLLVRILSENGKFTNTDLESFLKELKSKPLITYTVLTYIYGFEMAEEYVKLGEFTIYRADSTDLRSLIDPINIRIQNQCKSFKGYLTQCNVIRVDVTACDGVKANEIANKYFRSFDFVTAFFINDYYSRYNFGIYTFKHPSINTCIAIGSDNSFSANSTLQNPPNTLKIEELVSSQISSISDIWLLITIKKKTKLNSKVLGAIEWIGKALNETDVSKSFVMYMFSLETLLQYDEKTMLNPSITHQLSEALAFLLTTDYENRVKIVKLVKDLYSKRSAIVHGGESIVDPTDLRQLNLISSSAAWEFLQNPELQTVQNMEGFGKWLSYKKFTEPTPSSKVEDIDPSIS